MKSVVAAVCANYKDIYTVKTVESSLLEKIEADGLTRYFRFFLLDRFKSAELTWYVILTQAAVRDKMDAGVWQWGGEKR